MAKYIDKSPRGSVISIQEPKYFDTKKWFLILALCVNRLCQCVSLIFAEKMFRFVFAKVLQLEDEQIEPIKVWTLF